MSRVRQVPAAVLLLVLVVLALGVVHAVVTPVFQAPDELQQVSTIVDLAERGSYPAPGDAVVDPRLTAALGLLPAGGGPEDRDVPSLATLTGAPVGPAVTNQLTQHAPAFAAVMAVPWLVLRLAHWPVDQAVLVLRLLNVALVAALVPLLWLTTRRLGAGRAVATVAAATPVLLPQVTWWSATVNNDHLLTLAVGVATWLGVRFATGDHRRRTALGAGAAVGVALLTKGFALTALVLLVLAGVAAARSMPRRARPAVLRRASAGLALALALGGWWYVRNLVVFGALQPDGLQRPTVPGSGASVGRFLGLAPEALARSFVWNTGLLDNPVPAWAAWVAVAVVVVGAVVGAVRTHDLVVAALLVCVSGGTLVVVLAGALPAYLATDVAGGLQGRYLFAGWVGLAAVWALALPRGDTAGRVLVAATAVTAVVVQALAVHDLTATYRAGDLRRALAASEVPGPVVALAGALAVLGLVAVGLRGLADREGGARDPALSPRTGGGARSSRAAPGGSRRGGTPASAPR